MGRVPSYWCGPAGRRAILLLVLLLLSAAAVVAAINPFPARPLWSIDRPPPNQMLHPHPFASILGTVHPPSSLRRGSRGAFMNFRHRDDGGHEGQQLGRSGVWGRFRNATDALVDRIEDALEDEKQAIGDFFTREKIALEALEHRMADWWGRHKSGVRVALKGLTGATLCCTGTHFGRCVILFHSLRVTGWPSFKRAMEEVGNSYVRAREVVKEELGQVVKPRELLKAIRYEISGVQKIIKESQDALKDGKLTRAEAKATIRQAEIDMKRLSYEAWVVNQALDSFAALSAAIDVAKLKDVFKSVYTGALACVASANSVQVRKLSMSFDLGGILAQNTQCLAQTIMDSVNSKELARILPPETRRFVRLGINTLGAIEGLIIVNTLLPRMSLRVTSAALGGAWLAEALAETMDPTLRKHGWPVIEGHLPYCLLSAGFTAGGYIIQKRQPGRFPFLIERALLPLTIAEEKLKALKLFKTK